MNDPMELFREWHRDATATSFAAHPNAVCVSTVDPSGAPHARFVDLKAARRDGFVFCTSHASPKGVHIEACSSVALAFWWDHVGRQVRVLGTASRISAAEADAFFAERSRDAQLCSWAFDQSTPFAPGDDAERRMSATRQRFGDGHVPRPPEWGGYVVAPRRMEFLQFDAGRMHRRLLFELHDAGWLSSALQP